MSHKHFDSEDIRRLVQENPSLAARNKQIAKEGKEVYPIVSDRYRQKFGRFLGNLFAVNPKQLHGKAYVTEEIESHSNTVAVIGTVANGFNIITAFPLVLFAMADIPLLGFPLALAINLGVLKFSNKAVEVAAANKPGNQFWSEVGLFGVVALNVVQSLVSGAGSQLFLDKAGIGSRFAEQLVYAQVIKPLEDNLRIIQLNPNFTESKEKCEALKVELINIPLNTDKSDRIHYLAFGSYEDNKLPLEERSYFGSPIDLYPECPKAIEKEKRYTERLTAAKDELQQIKAKVADNGSLIYLKEQKLDTYQQHFDRNDEVKSGTIATKLATEMFVEKIINGDWASLGLTLYIFSLSMITSAISVLLIASHAKREDIQMSWSDAVARERDIYLAEKTESLRKSAKADSNFADYISYDSTDILSPNGNGNGSGKHH